MARDTDVRKTAATATREHPARRRGRMRNVRILIANEPRAYREAFAGALRLMRPNSRIIEAGAEDLDREVERFKPDVVLCSSVSATVETKARSWILLYPEDEPLAMVSTAGELSTVGDVDLEDIVALVDRTAELIKSNPAPSSL